MEKKRKKIIFLIIFLALFFIVKRKIELARAPVFGKRPVLVSVFYSRRKDIRSFKEYLAKVEPINKADVSTRINAVVEKIFVDEGSVVKKGDLLAELDKGDIVARLNSAKGNFFAARENFSYWKKEYSRDENLFKQGAVSEEERDRAKNNLAQATAKLKNAKGNIIFWQTDLNYARLKSPYDGIVAKRFVDGGDLAVVGRPLFTIEDRSRLKFSFDVPQEDIPFITQDDPVFYKVPSISKQKEAKITNIFPSIDNGKLLHLEVYLDDKEGLYVGQFISLRVLVAREDNVVVVPNGAISGMGNAGPFVFLIKDKKLKRYPVIVGLESDGFVEIKNLKEGVAVVKTPYLSWVQLVAGEQVKVMNKK